MSLFFWRSFNQQYSNNYYSASNDYLYESLFEEAKFLNKTLVKIDKVNLSRYLLLIRFVNRKNENKAIKRSNRKKSGGEGSADKKFQNQLVLDTERKTIYVYRIQSHIQTKKKEVNITQAEK